MALSFGEALMQFITGSGNQTQSGSQFGSAPSGYGDMYDALFAANPYRKQTYQQSGWQKLLSSMGFRTGYDDWLDQTSTNIAEWDASIMSMLQQNQYNEPAQQAERMRQAGINPDLLGTGDVASAASPMEDPNGMPAQDSNEIGKAAGLLSGFASSCMSAFGLAAQLMKTSSEISSIKAGMQGIELENNNKAVDLIDKIIVGSVPLSAWSSDTGVDSYFQPIDLSMYGFSGEQLGRANQILADRRESFKNNSEILRNVYDRYGFTSGINQGVMTGLLPDNDKFSGYSGGDQMFDVFLGSYARIAKRILDLGQTNELVNQETLIPQQQLNQEIQGDITTEELATKNGLGYGQTVGESESYFKKVENIIASEKARMYHELDIKAKSGDTTAKMILHAMALQDMMQFEVSGGLNLDLLKGLTSIVGGLFDKQSSSKHRGFGLNFDFTAKTK